MSTPPPLPPKPGHPPVTVPAIVEAPTPNAIAAAINWQRDHRYVTKRRPFRHPNVR